MSSSALIAQPLQSEGAFNWIYLTDWVVNGVLCLFFLFYFNRLFATLLLYLVRLYLWRSLHVYVDIKALQISPLAGRIFFKGIRYHGDNETIFVHGGYVTWRYWLRSVKQCQIFEEPKSPNGVGEYRDGSDDNERKSQDEETGKESKASDPSEKSSLPCRISMNVYGVEAFLYNRGPAYDWILETVAKADAANATTRHQTKTARSFESRSYVDPRHQSSQDSSSIPSDSAHNHKQEHSTPEDDSGAQNSPDLRQTASSWSSNYDARSSHRGKTPDLTPPAFLRLLPIHVQCSKGAAVLGSENTKAIITAKFDNASGEFDASPSGPLDIFKILMNFQVVHPYIQLKPNLDYKKGQLTEASTIKNIGRTADESDENKDKSTKFAPLKVFRAKYWSEKLSSISIWPRDSSASVAMHHSGDARYQKLPFITADVPGNGRWLGLTRYLNDEQNDEHDEWGAVEYANSSLLADIKKVDFGFYWDIAGPVGPRSEKLSAQQSGEVDEINGSVPPEYGMTLVVHGGQVNYGPWADRHRIFLQQLFFPYSYADAVPTEKLLPGASRLCTIFKLNMRVEDDVILRIPFREPSKDAKWKGRATAATGKLPEKGGFIKRRGKSKRPFRDSKRRNATQGRDVRPFAWFDIKVTSGTTIDYIMDMYPKTNGFKAELVATFNNVDIFSSLNHGLLWRCPQVRMNCDLSNPLAWNGLRTWTFNVTIDRLDFFLLRDHTFLLVDMIEDWISGQVADYYTFAPYRYKLNVHFQDYKLYLNTNDANIVDNADDLDENDFIILYGRTLDADLLIPIDRLAPAENAISFNVISTYLGFELCMPPKSTLNELVTDNDVAQLESVEVIGAYTYCGEVRAGLTETLYLDITGKHLNVAFFGWLGRHFAKIKENYFGETVHFRTLDEFQDLVRRNFQGADSEHPPVKSNDLDVLLDIRAEDVNIQLPSGLYSSEEHVRIRVDSTDVDLRVNNYYLELMVNSSPLELSYTARIESNDLEPAFESPETQLSIDGVKVFGHRLFGIAPSEPPYVSNWDIDSGNIFGECTVLFLEKFIGAAQSFALGIADAENAVPLPNYTELHDSTFVRFACPEIRLWCRMEEAAVLLFTENFGGYFHDLAGKFFSQQLNMVIPNLTIACIDTEHFSRHRNHASRIAHTTAYMRTTVLMSMVQRNLDFEKQRQLQQDHITFHDTRRGERAPFMHTLNASKRPSLGAEAISLDLPPLPSPIQHWRITDYAASTGSDLDLNRTFQVNPEKPDARRTDQRNSNLHQSTTTRLAAPLSRSVALPSPYEASYFPLLDVQPDVTNVPIAPQPVHSKPGDGQPTSFPEDEEGSNSLDDDTIHTSFMISTDPNVLMFCAPEGVRAVSHIVAQVQPRYPEQILDNFHFKTVTEVLASYARKRGNNSLTDLSLNIPYFHLRFHSDHMPQPKANRALVFDRYNVTANDLKVCLRLKTVPSRKNEVDSNTMHITLKTLQAAAQEGAENNERDDAAFKLVINDILVWLADSDRISIHSSFYNIEITTVSKQVEYLATLIHRTTMLVDEFRARFEDIFEMQSQRLQYLIFRLLELGDDRQDPSFLTRPSYVIRSSPDHIRNSDSWKIISRFHYNYLKLEQDKRLHLADDCITNFKNLPLNAKTEVFSKLNSWLSWDAEHVKESFAVRIIYGTLADIEKLHDRSNVPVAVSVRSANIKAVIDPGPEQTDLSFDQIAISLVVTPAPPPSALAVFHDYNPVKTTVVQIKIGKFSLRVNWNIYNLIDHVLELFKQQAPRDSDVVLQRKETVVALNQAQEKFHIVVSADSGIICAKALNVKLSITSIRPKISVTGVGWEAMHKQSTVNILLAATETTLQLDGRNRKLLETDIVAPTLFVNYSNQVQDYRKRGTVELAGDSKEIRFRVHEEILGLIETANDIISQEATYIHELIQRQNVDNLVTKPSASSNDRESPSQDDSFRVSVTMFLNDYLISLALFNDLVYAISGRDIRLSVVPEQTGSKYQIDYDLKAHTHKIINQYDKGSHVPPSLHVPPINGTIQLDIQKASVNAVGLFTVEKILLDGFAVYGFFNAFSPSNIQSAVEAIESDVNSLKQKVQQSFPMPRTQHEQKLNQPKSTKFSIGVVFAGLAISADAPATSREQRPSNVLFDIRSIHVRMSNHSKVNDEALTFPEMQASVQEISLELRHMERGALRSCGKLALSSQFSCNVVQEADKETRKFNLLVTGPDIEINAETAPLLVGVITHLQDRVKVLDFSRERKYLKRLRQLERGPNASNADNIDANGSESSESAQNDNATSVQSTFSFELRALRIGYFIDDHFFKPLAKISEDLVLSINSIRLLARNQDDAQLRIERLQLALLPENWTSNERPYNSALMSEIIFNVAHTSSAQERKVVFKAAGKTLDIQLDPRFVLPASDLEKSFTLSSRNTRIAAEHLRLAPSSGGFDKKKLLGGKALSSFATDFNFAGAVVRLQRFAKDDSRRATAANLRSQQGRYGQFSNESSSNAAILRAPGVALKVRYEDENTKEPSLNIEVKVDGSNNTLQPTVVPLILQVSDSVKKVLRERDEIDTNTRLAESEKPTTQTFVVDESIVQTDPRAVLGRTKLNLGIRICRQEFSLTCQPIAKVNAHAKLEDVYITVNDVDSEESGHFFAGSATFKGLKASLQHVYSREATFGLDIHSIVLSVMNSKHISGTSGVSAILNIKPTSTQINAKQLQDLLLFREIWLPTEIRNTTIQRQAAIAQAPQEYFVQRYQQVAAATAFPWNATVAIEELKVEVDLGQSIGKTSFKIGKLWAHSKKTTQARQNLCVGIGEVSMSSSGRMSGFIELEKVKVRTSIAWPLGHEVAHIPLIQGSVGFDRLKAKAAFDYQAFAVADISSFEFIMYNVRDPKQKSGDRLVAILYGEKMNAYCISASAALGLSLVQAFERLVQDKQVAYDQAIREIEKFLRRRSSLLPARAAAKEVRSSDVGAVKKESPRCPISLQTDVVVTLRSLDVGAFPGTLLDRQVLKGEASDIQARFAVVLEHGKIHSGLGLTLGQLRVALAPVAPTTMPKTLGEIEVDEVAKNASSAKGGVILRVPKVVATMQTWQAQDSNVIDYIFKSSFEGKIDVGWNYSRISFIRGMWATHERNYAARLGKPLPESAVKITGAPKALPQGDTAPLEAMSDEMPREDTATAAKEEREQQKITAEVNLPQSKYTYKAREPPIIETPQLRDMGEATPPLEWVGLHRDRLPNLTHQIVIVTLLEVAKEVEDAYSHILGSA